MAGVIDPPLEDGQPDGEDEDESFDWDEDNAGKNLAHGVQDWEIEEALLDRITSRWP